jgi:hypothetical protein
MIALVLLAGCGGNGGGTPDAGVDDSCGIDCAAQTTFNLIVGKCFDYSATSTAQSPADLGAQVGDPVTLEGGVKGIPVTYRSGGLTKMEDIYTIKNGDLYLLRRSWQGSESVTYKDDSGNIVGVLILRPTTGPGENLGTPVKADFINGSARTSDQTTYSISTVAATSAEQKVPMQQFTDGLKLLISETPLHGADTRRFFVKEKGFIKFSSTLQIVGGTSQEYSLQNIKDVAAGTFSCP